MDIKQWSTAIYDTVRWETTHWRIGDMTKSEGMGNNPEENRRYGTVRWDGK